MEPVAGGNDSVLGRLLEEISWEGSSVRRYRDGGRGLENVLTAEVLTALDFLPRRAFLGAVLDHAHGADEARRLLSRQVEEATLTFLPEEIVLRPDQRSRGERLIVQPDASLSAASAYALVEAKRIRRSSFQPQQLAREYLGLTRDAGTRVPLLLVILGAAPPVAIVGGGRMTIEDAIASHLPVVHGLMGDHPVPLEELAARMPDVCAWTTWRELTDVVLEQQSRLAVTDPSAAGSIDRLVTSLVRSVARHS
ncbi:hypothetical protein [Lentzea sp. NPDC060358]|uniref:hypothetical protein n=1 Tax=Lentzea sp. NPDC060358 TaxID=3347103 RepID=UPI00365407B4